MIYKALLVGPIEVRLIIELKICQVAQRSNRAPKRNFFLLEPKRSLYADKKGLTKLKFPGILIQNVILKVKLILLDMLLVRY